jgi:phospholipase/lecithinase/hemolysin
MINKFTLGQDDTLRFGAPPPVAPDFFAPPGFFGTPMQDGEPALKFSTLYAFGDSLSDVANDYTLSLGVLPTGAIYSHGRFSNGKVWVQDLAKQLGLGAVTASLNGGRDFAYGGAETGGETLHSVNPLDLPSQLGQFLVDDPQPKANALYTLSIGANDTIDAISAYASNPNGVMTDIQQAVNNEASFINSLAGLGAKNFVILNVPDLGKTPEEAGASAVASNLSALYDQDLTTALQALAAKDNLKIHLVDTYALIDQAVADPAAFGLKNVTTPVWTGDYENPFSGHLNAYGAAQNGYLFFDHLHPTATGHLAVADAAHAALSTLV